MNTQTSIGPGANRGGNESHGNADGCGNKTLGDQGAQEAPAGADVGEDAGPQAPDVAGRGARKEAPRGKSPDRG